MSIKVECENFDLNVFLECSSWIDPELTKHIQDEKVVLTYQEVRGEKDYYYAGCLPGIMIGDVMHHHITLWIPEKTEFQSEHKKQEVIVHELMHLYQTITKRFNDKYDFDPKIMELMGESNSYTWYEAGKGIKIFDYYFSKHMELNAYASTHLICKEKFGSDYITDFEEKYPQESWIYVLKNYT